MTIRNRLILMLTVPLVALVLVAAFGFAQLSSDSELLEDAQATAEDAILADRVGRAIGTERLGFEAGFSGSDLSILTDATDAAIAAAASESGDLGALGELTLANVEVARASDGGVRLQEYNAAIEQINEFTDAQSIRGFSPDGVSVLKGLQQARSAVDTQEASWTSVWSIDNAEPGTVVETTRLFANADDELSDAGALTTESGQNFYLAPTRSETAGELIGLEIVVLRSLTAGETPDLGAGEVFDLLWENRLEWNQAAEQGSQFLLSDISTEATQTDSDRSLFTLLAVLAAFLLAVLIFVISRSIVGPLTRLIEAAEDVTKKRLPRAVAELRRVGADDAPPTIREIPKETDDEIGALVDAFNSVQGTAMQVSTEQAISRRNVAEMFVNLGRRNQQLNHRMLNLISDLERDEQDPDVLKGLYRLDHMATRMRRNAESLLVLAGNRSPRQWSRPVSAEDVMRAALAEVENFDRIEIGEIPDASLRGSVVTDVTHLLAELLDNATNFSDPTTTVSISGHETDDGIQIEIEDTGLGITESDLIELNRRITNPPALDEAPSRLLGLFVVGRLAQEHGIDVRLDSQTGVGTVATISLPHSMIPQDTGDGPTPLQTIDMDPGVGEEVRAELGLDTVDDVPEATAPVVDTWNPDASHEVALADAAIPTMDEVEEAMPSFPSVTIDAPEAPEMPSVTAPAEAVLPPAEAEAAAWPLNAIDPNADGLPVRELHDRGTTPDAPAAPAPVAETAPEPAPLPAPEEEAPGSVPEHTVSSSVFDLAPPPPVDGAAAPVPAPSAEVASPEPAHAVEQPSAEVTAPTMDAMPAPAAPVEVVAPTMDAMPAPAAPVEVPEPMPAPIAPVDVAAPTMDAMPAPAAPVDPGPAHAAAPEVAPAPVAEAAAPAPAPAPATEKPSSPGEMFGGLPVRSPQAALSDADGDNVMPLPQVEPAAPTTKAQTTGAFAAFASGVNRAESDTPDSDTPS